MQEYRQLNLDGLRQSVSNYFMSIFSVRPSVCAIVYVFASRMLFTLDADAEDSVDPIYSLLKSAAGLPTGRTPASSSRSSPAPVSVVTDVQPLTVDVARLKGDSGGAVGTTSVQTHRSNSSSPHKSQSPHQRPQQQQQLRKLPPALHLPGLSNMSPM